RDRPVACRGAHRGLLRQRRGGSAVALALDAALARAGRIRHRAVIPGGPAARSGGRSPQARRPGAWWAGGMSLVRRWVHLSVPIPSGRAIVLGAAVGAVASLPLLRGWAMTFGATDAELEAKLPGDELTPGADVVATRGITIAAPPERVWPWLVQIGQGRGGFYSYDALENLVGLDITSADRVEARWQDLAVGDLVHL